MSEVSDDVNASKKKLEFSAEYSVLFAPFLREILSRTPKSAFKMPENVDSSKNPLDDFLNEQKSLIPWLSIPWQIRICTDRIIELGLGGSAKGIFRVPGSSGIINTLFDKLDHAELPELEDTSVGVEEVSGLLKKLIRDRFKVDIFAESLQEEVISAVKQDDVDGLKVVVFKLGQYSFAFLKEIFLLLRLIADQAELNMMNINNLATIFGGMLQFLGKKIQEDVRTTLCHMLIEHYHVIFGSHTSLIQSVMAQKNVPVYLDDGTKKQVLITANETAATLKNKIIVKAKQANTMSEESLNRAVLCEIGDREILELTPDIAICKKKAFILTDKYTPSNIRLRAVQRVSSRPSLNPSGTTTDKSDRSSECSSGTPSPRSAPVAALMSNKSERRAAAKRHSSSDGSLIKEKTSSSKLALEPEDKNSREEAETRVNEFAEQELISISRWFNSLSDISELNNTKFTQLLKEHGYVNLDSLLTLLPSVNQLVRVGIPVYFAHLIHSRVIQEKQSILVKTYKNSISLWLDSLQIPNSMVIVSHFSLAGYNNLHSVFSFPPSEIQLVDMAVPLLAVNTLMRNFPQ